MAYFENINMRIFLPRYIIMKWYDYQTLII